MFYSILFIDADNVLALLEVPEQPGEDTQEILLVKENPWKLIVTTVNLINSNIKWLVVKGSIAIP